MNLHLVVVGWLFLESSINSRTLGGHEMTLRLREHLIAAWKANGGGDVRASPRAMEKLLKEAERLKVVLSANTEFYAQIESLLDDKDFKHLVSDIIIV